MAKLTAQQLLARIQQTATDAEVLKSLWQDYFPPDLPLPPDWEIKNAVRRLTLADLEEGMKSYLVAISKGNANPTSQKAMKYICGTAWKIHELENPDQQFHPTARRIRNAERDPDSYYWDGEAFHNASPEQRQKIVAENIAKQKSRRVQS